MEYDNILLQLDRDLRFISTGIIKESWQDPGRVRAVYRSHRVVVVDRAAGWTSVRHTEWLLVYSALLFWDLPLGWCYRASHTGNATLTCTEFARVQRNYAMIVDRIGDMHDYL